MIKTHYDYYQCWKRSGCFIFLRNDTPPFKNVEWKLKKKLPLFINDTLNSSKVTVKTFIMLQKIRFKINVHQNILKNKMLHDFHKNMRLFSTLLIIINISWASDPHIRVIPEGSCDTVDWSNDAENPRNKLHFNIYSHRKHLF